MCRFNISCWFLCFVIDGSQSLNEGEFCTWLSCHQTILGGNWFILIGFLIYIGIHWAHIKGLECQNIKTCKNVGTHIRTSLFPLPNLEWLIMPLELSVCHPYPIQGALQLTSYTLVHTVLQQRQRQVKKEYLRWKLVACSLAHTTLFRGKSKSWRSNSWLRQYWYSGSAQMVMNDRGAPRFLFFPSFLPALSMNGCDEGGTTWVVNWC